MLVRATLAVAILLMAVSARAQTAKTKALIDLLHRETKEDTVRARRLVRVASAFFYDRSDTAQVLLREAQALSRKIGDPRGLARALNYLSVFTEDFDTLYLFMSEAIPAAKAAGDLEQLAYSYATLSFGYMRSNEITGRETTHNIPPEALSYADSAVIIAQAIGDSAELSVALSKKAEILNFLGRLDEAHGAVGTARKLCGTCDDPDFLLVFGISGDLEYRAGEYGTALQDYAKALELARPVGYAPYVAYYLSQVARANARLGRFDAAIDSAEVGLRLAGHEGLGKERVDLLTALYEIHKMRGDVDEALAYHERLLTVSDSLNTSTLSETVSKLNLRLQAVKDRERISGLEKDGQISEQKRARQRVGLIALGAGAVLLILLALVIQNRYRLKRRALARSEQQKAIIEKEKARSEELLLNILPEEVAEELKDTGAAAAKHFDQATILFSDFKGFTQASEKMSPQELVAELNTCFKAFDTIITARGIEKIKTIGDAYMCAGGLPVPASSTPAGVVHAALEMQAFVKQRKAERDEQGLPAFEMRVGIHTGPVVAGIVGVKKFQYDIWGDTVNTASRMESSGEVGRVNISEATYALVKNEKGFTFTPRGKVLAKGKGEMEMYFITNG